MIRFIQDWLGKAPEWAIFQGRSQKVHMGLSVEKLGEIIAEKGKVDRELHENACCV